MGNREIIVEEFNYNDEQSYEANFYRWRLLNNDEREEHKEELYTVEKAVEVFEKQYPRSFWKRLLNG